MELTRETLLSQEVVSVSKDRDEAILANGWRLEIIGDSDCCAYQSGEFYKASETYELYETEDNYDDYTETDIQGTTLNIVVKETNNGYYWPCATLNVYDKNNNLIGEVMLHKLEDND